MAPLRRCFKLAKDPLKCATKFAMDALDKLLNYNLSAKYWLKNELNFDNIIRDGFYDYGSAGFGPKSSKFNTSPTLSAITWAGVVNPAAVGEFSHKFKITELKLRAGTNVLPLGLITTGTFYHRALLFKVICDKVGLGPCSIVRGEYKRAWNVIDFDGLDCLQIPTDINNTSQAASKAQTHQRHQTVRQVLQQVEASQAHASGSKVLIL
ncbi:hypothetical protein BC829DRAFT_412880 [Chytridium lagenaria]|nr:hypothetical protein BC829DRAFT_412880 [Chytridium lagenaria]